jgi:hypothetical protein
LKKTKIDRDSKKKGNEKGKGKTQKDELSNEWKRVAYIFQLV